MDNLYLAKTKPSIKGIVEHTKDLLNLFEEFIKVYPDAFNGVDIRIREAIRYAIMYHDLGKMNTRFQNILYEKLSKQKIKFSSPEMVELEKKYINSQINQIPHGLLSAAFIDIEKLSEKIGEELAVAVVIAVCFHHDRRKLLEQLQKDRDGTVFDLIKNVIAYDLKQQAEEFKCSFIQIDYINSRFLYKKFIKHPEVMDKKRYAAKNELTFWHAYALIKGMLNRLDYAASGEHEVFEIPHVSAGEKTLSSIIVDHIENKFKQPLRSVQEYMMENKDKNVIVTASTGIGKTEAALLWIDTSKAFYTLPLKVSINAIYERIKNAPTNENTSGYGYSKVELLHSDVMTRYLNEYDAESGKELLSPTVRYQMAKLFANPLTICTLDQLFTFVMKHNGSEPLLATLAYSKLVIDEIQMYSPDVVAAILYGLKLINILGGKFAIITATLPPVFFKFMDKLGLTNDKYQKPDKPFILGIDRHLINIIDEEFDYDHILQSAITKKVLVICNTVKKAQLVFRELNMKKDLYAVNYVRLIHSKFIMSDRRKLETEIMKFSNNESSKGNFGIWISTQIVEASLDIDFDELHTEMCTADSLLQRMGRCFRKREYISSEPNIYIYNTKNGVGKKSIYDIDIYDASVDALRQYNGKVFKEEKKHEYIASVYDEEINSRLRESNYYKTIAENLEWLEKIEPFDIKKSEAKLRNIQSINVMPETIYIELYKSGKMNNWKQSLDEEKNINKTAIFSEISDYCISIRNSKINREKCDKAEIGYLNGMEIHRMRCNYEFDSELLLGEGLGQDKPIEEENYI